MNEIETALQRARDTKALEFGEGAMERLPKMLEALFPGKKVVIVADDNTYNAAGRKVCGILDAAGTQMEDSFIFKDPELYAEWSYLQQLEAYLKERDAVPVAVGSGVINDLTKLASHHLGRRYVIVGTAASMDGYTAYGASITYEGNKQTFDCPAPLGVVFDPAVAAKAPAGMSASGYADLLAKVPAGADWIISDAVGSEAIDDFAFGLVQKNLRKALSDPAAVADGDVEATGMLADGLIMSGFAMQAISSSRPASGTDHQFSHFWDMEGLCHNGRHVSHGFKVGIGTMVSTACLEFLISKDLTRLDIDACVAAWPTWEAQEAYIRKMFEGKPGHLARGLAESRAKYCGPEEIRCQLNAIVAVWPELRERIREQIIPFDDVKEMLRLVGAPSRPEEIGVSKARLRDTFKCIPFMRNRYTGIDLIYRAGLLDEVTEHIFGRGGRFEVE
ncbi:MAG: sn-glycerol-1-phosphate dehydrogenase [Candidatus Cryptobacteroides sp.]|nr:sn-glycerol-1-phosphate dehydrogenase [Candidatus Cryptobacteroides sp.]